MLEGNHQRGGSAMGFVTDIRKAFEAVPRAPVRELALLLGGPPRYSGGLALFSRSHGAKVHGLRGGPYCLSQQLRLPGGERFIVPGDVIGGFDAACVSQGFCPCSHLFIFCG